uniref:Caspase recruitment domain family member 6 n=1 Tax=Oryctolagus cuniculus TaxID=9986 RepID=A0A5F9C4W1_RABIT|nr:caspase recruitment domain-containing protein 6 [Oryctolagus cuniculus]
MDTESVPSEIIEKERKTLLEILQQDPDSILDMLTSRRLISEEEFETLENVTDPLKKSRKLLILVQKKGEVSCQHFLQCLFSTFPESAAVWCLSRECLMHENNAPPQSMGVPKKPKNDAFALGKKQPGNPENTLSFKEKELLDLETSGIFRNKKTTCKETVLSSSENKKENNALKVSLPNSVEEVEYKVPATITYLKDGQRYEEPDDSLYLGEEEYLEIVGYPKDAEPTVEERDFEDPGHVVYDVEGNSEYSEAVVFSDEKQSGEDSETSISLEEEEESMEERKKVFKDVLSHLNMDRSRKLLPEFVNQFSLDRGHRWTPETPGDLAWNFLVKVQALDVTARDSFLRHRILDEDNKEGSLTGVEKLETQDVQIINPLDVICASMLCADSSLQREVMSNMYQCQFALPLLLPDAENNKSILMLAAMKGIVKKQSTQSSGGPVGDTEKSLTRMKLPVISFVRLGHCSFSKSRILNRLLSPAQLEPRKIFLHQDLPVPVLPRQISDGLVEITWCFSGNVDLKETSNVFQRPVAVANLRGDLESFWTQFGFLVEISSAMFFFTDCLGEKEWNLLMFLGDAAIKRCYFMLSPQAKENEEAQVFQRILKLKSSQLLFWEGEEGGDRRKSMKGLQAALQEVMSSSLRSVSVEDMASLARELGIQVDQDFENTQGIHVSPSENVAGITEGDDQQILSQPKSLSGSQTKMPVSKPGARYEVSQNHQNFHHTPVFMPPGRNSQPLSTGTGGNSNHVSLKAPLIRGSLLGSEQRFKWFCPLPFHYTSSHGQGTIFGTQCLQPQMSYSGVRFMDFSRTARGHPTNGILGSPPIPIFQSVGAYPGRTQTVGAGAVVSQVSHSNSLGLQPAGAVRKPQPGPSWAQGTQLTKATETLMRTTSYIKEPQFFETTGTMQKLVKPAPLQGAQLKTEGQPSNPTFQTRSHSISENKLLPSSQFKSNQSKPSQVQHFQSKPSQPVSSKTNPQAKPPQLQPFQAVPALPKPTQLMPHQPQPSQNKLSQPIFPRLTQPNLSQTSSSKGKASHSRGRPKRVGKH